MWWLYKGILLQRPLTYTTLFRTPLLLYYIKYKNNLIKAKFEEQPQKKWREEENLKIIKFDYFGFLIGTLEDITI